MLAWGYGHQRVWDSATGGPIYGNHLHIYIPRPIYWHVVWGLREPATVGQVEPYMEIICICSVGMGVWGLESLRQCDRWAHIWEVIEASRGAATIFVFFWTVDMTYPDAKSQRTAIVTDTRTSLIWPHSCAKEISSTIYETRAKILLNVNLPSDNSSFCVPMCPFARPFCLLMYCLTLHPFFES